MIPLGGLPAAAPRFVVANHVSWTDIIALSSVYPLVFLAKSEVADWPVLGFLARLQGTIFVDRANRRAIPTVNAALAGALRAGRDVVVFAEGTSSDGGRVLNFNASHFAMLHAKGAENSEAFDVGWYGDMSFVPHLWGLMRRGGARCRITFGAPIDPSACLDRKELARETQGSVQRLLEVGSFARAGVGL